MKAEILNHITFPFVDYTLTKSGVINRCTRQAKIQFP